MQDLLNAATATWAKALDAIQEAALYAVPAACVTSFTHFGTAKRVTAARRGSGRDFDVS